MYTTLAVLAIIQSLCQTNNYQGGVIDVRGSPESRSRGIFTIVPADDVQIRHPCDTGKLRGLVRVRLRRQPTATSGA